MIVGLHSYFGGAGKALIGYNLAHVLAGVNKKVLFVNLELGSTPIHRQDRY